LPPKDKPRVKEAVDHYHQWISNLEIVDGTPDAIIDKMVALLNDYRKYIDVDLIFDSAEDFLYRQKGQLKLDNSVIEEFLPRLIGHPRLLPELESVEIKLGPTQSFSSVYFNSSLSTLTQGGGLAIKTKNQDFAIAKPLYLSASHRSDFKESIVRQTFISYVAAECKTNLDKTMFQEACATAQDLKSAVSDARYYLLCEWLDMTPQSTVPTAIDEIIILRKAKRINSNKRQHFSDAEKRQMFRGEYIEFLEQNPFQPEMFERFIGHIRKLFNDEALHEADVLQTGYF